MIFISIAMTKLITLDVHAQDERRAGLFDEHRQSIEQLSTDAQNRISQLKEREIAAEARQVTMVSDLHQKNELTFRFNTESKKLLPAHSGAGIELIAIKENLEIISDNEYAWTGTVVEKDNKDRVLGNILLINRNNGEVTGNLHIINSNFMIRHMGQNQHVLLDVIPSGEREQKYFEAPPEDETSDQKDHRNNDTEPHMLAPDSDGTESTTSSVSCGPPHEVNVLVVYTSSANDGDISGDISLARQQANNALTNSEVNNLTYNIAHEEEVSFTSDDDIGQDMEEAQADLEINNLQQTHNADAVVLVTDGDYGAIAGAAYDIYASDESEAYAIVQREQVGNTQLTFAHELGHLHGADHHPNEKVYDPPIFSYGLGHRAEVNMWPYIYYYSTVMAYEFDFQDPFGPTYNTTFNFSNPDVYWHNDVEPTGTSTRNNAQVMQNTASHISGFFPDQLQADIDVVSYNPPNATLEADVCVEARIHILTSGA